MNEGLCLLQIEMLLHFHSKASPFPNIGMPSQQQCLADMIKSGLIEPSGSSDRPWRTTATGDKLVYDLCKVAGDRLWPL